MVHRTIDRVIKALQRSLFPDPRLRPRGRPNGCSSWAVADVWCFPTTVESLEQRTLLSGIAVQAANAPVANDDSASTSPEVPVIIDVLANDFDPDGTLDSSTLAISSGPAHGTVTIQQTILDSNDDGSPVGDSRGSALSGVVGLDGRITLSVSGSGDVDFTGAHGQSGDYALYVRLGEADFSNFYPGVFDYQLTESLTPGEADPFSVAGLTPGTEFVAWIDNTVGSGAPDTVLGLVGPNAVAYTPDPGFEGTDVFGETVQDNDGAVFNAGMVTVTVANQPPIASDDSTSTAENTPVVIDVLANDLDPDGTLDSSILTVSSGPARGTVSVQQTDLGPVFLYTPNPIGRVLVVDDPRDVDDGNYSPGHLSLREAIQLANADHYSDVFRYTVRDSDGLLSSEATVTIEVTHTATTITFAPSLTARGPAVLSLSQVGDTTADNSAFAITSNITIIGPAGRRGVTLAGTGSSGDLRLFRVLAGGNLTLQGLTMSNWSTDTNGGVLAVDPGGIVSLTDCTLSNNSALSQGGAIFNLSGTDSEVLGVVVGVTLTNCTLSGNRAHDGGAYNGGGQTYGGYAIFTNCIFTGNTAVDRGGAIALYDSRADLTNCTLVGNSAHQGGGISGGDIVLDHSTFIRNTAVDGGGIFTGVGSGGTDGNIVKAGGPGGGSVVDIDSCTFTGNSAQHRGGGLYLVETNIARFMNNTISGNRAQQGGGLFLDDSEPGFFTRSLQPGFGGNVFSGNSATATGGGIFINNGSLTIRGWTFTNNVARQGAALFNNLGSVTMTDSTVVKNRSRQGTQLFNHLGILSLTRSTVSDITRMAFLPTDSTSGTQFAAPNPGLEPTAVAPPAGNLIVTAADGIRYALTPDRLLLRQYPGGNWSILDDLVQSYKVAPNGEIYWLNDRGDLLRSHAGRAGDLIGQHVQSFAMDQNGTVYDLSTGAGPGNFAAYRSLTAPLLDPVVVEVAKGEPTFCMNPPTYEEVVQALGLAGPAIQNLRMVAEPIVDRADDLTYFPNIGLARMHHCHYKVSVYYDTEMNGSLSGVIYIDKDYLFREVPGQVAQSTLASQNNIVTTATAPIATAAIATVSDANRSDNIHSMWTGPDGTIYKLGGDYNGQHLVGTPPLPLVLWRLPPGGNWEPLLRVSAAEVAPDNTLFVLNTNQELQRLAPGASQWTTVASGVQSFTMTKGGTVYALDANGRLIRVQPARHGDQWVLSTLATGVQSFALTADGVLYTLNNRNELQRFTGIGNRFVRIATRVSSLEQAPDGTIYSLHQSGQLKRLEPRGRWSLLGTGIQSFQLDADGVLFALNRQHELKRLTPGGHWSLVDVDVQSFVLAPNALRNVYILTTHQELKRLEAGYSWTTLRTDVISLSIDSSGIVTARDTLDRSWMYWSPFTAALLDPVENRPVPPCQDPPTRDEILQLLHIPDGPNVTVVSVEPTVDTTDPPRWFANLGNIPAARLHHCQYQCTVQYTNSEGLQTVVIDIDFDHLIRYVAGPF